MLYMLCIVLFWTTISSAEMMYIKNIMEVPLRTGKGTEYRIIAMMKSGDSVEIIEQDADWSMVKSLNGKEGWTATRYLTSEKPKEVAYETIKASYDQLQADKTQLSTTHETLQNENKRIGEELTITKKQLEEISLQYNELKKNSAEYMQLKKENDELKATLSKQHQDIGYLQTNVTKKEYMWFLSGAGVLLLGILLGYNARQNKRRSSLY